jgi:hypothetical protein
MFRPLALWEQSDVGFVCSCFYSNPLLSFKLLISCYVRVGHLQSDYHKLYSSYISILRLSPNEMFRTQGPQISVQLG